MEFTLTRSNKFNWALMKFKLDREKVIQDIYKTVKQKEPYLKLGCKTFFHSRYKEREKEYIIVGYVTKEENALQIEASDIWDEDPAKNIEIKECGLRIIK